MTLSSDEMVRAGEAALRLLDLDGTVTLDDGPSWSGLSIDGSVIVSGNGWGETIPLNGEAPPVDVVWHIVDNLTNDLSESDAHWGVAFPRCPGHRHPASYEAVDDAMVLRCPSSGEEIRRVRP